MEDATATLDSKQQRSLTHCFPNHPGEMLKQLDLQRHHGAFTDITVRIVSDAGDSTAAATDFRLHRCVLCAASSKLQLLVFAMITNATDLLTLRDVTVLGFQCIISYIYTGVIRVDQSNVEDVVIAARALEIAEVERAAVDLAKRLGSDTSMAPPTEAALSLMRMSQGIGLGKASDPPASSQLAFLSTSQQRSPWVGKAEGIMQDEGGPTSSCEPSPIQNSPNPSCSSQSVVVLPTNQATYVSSSHLKGQAREGSGHEEEQKAGQGTLLPLAILSPDGHSAVQILNTPSATTTVTSMGNLQDENQEDTHAADDKKAELDTGGDNLVKSEEGTVLEGDVKEAMDIGSNSDLAGNASKEIAIQTSIASYTVRMKRKKPAAAAVAVVLPGRSRSKARVTRRSRGRPRRSQSQASEVSSSATQVSSKPLKKRLREQPKQIKAKATEVTAPTLKGKVKLDKPSANKEAKASKETFTKKKIRICSKCGRPFGKKSALLRHMQMHEATEMFACDVCGYSYPRSSELTQHRRKHATQRWVCHECSMQFEDPRLFKKHTMTKHQDARPFRCQVEGCSFRSGRPSNVDKHAIIHSGVKSYTCQQCGKGFAQPNGLQSHLKSCYQKRNYICDLCGQRFNYLQSMKSHRMLHTGEKPHECVHCGARFADHRNFKRHKRVHESGGKPGQPGKQRVRDPQPETVESDLAKAKPHRKKQQQEQAVEPVTSVMLPVTSSVMSPVMASQPTIVRTVRTGETSSGIASGDRITNSLIPVANNIILQPTNTGVSHQILNNVHQAAITVAPQPALQLRLEPMNMGISSEQVLNNTQYIEAIPVSVAETHTITVAQPANNAVSSQTEFIQVAQPMTTWSQLPFTVTRTFENL